MQEPGGTIRNPKPITPWVTSMAYTALGQPKAWNWAGGDSAARTFDLDGRMASNEFATLKTLRTTKIGRFIAGNPGLRTNTVILLTVHSELENEPYYSMENRNSIG